MAGVLSKGPVCKDCIAERVKTSRPAPYPGPRCYTHHLAERKRRRARAHERRIQASYEMDSDMYWLLYRSQGGLCAICQRARGAVRNLSVDHDHACTAGHPPEKGCALCWRGIICGRCNYDLLGMYPLAVLQRAVEYLLDPPAQKVLRLISTRP